MIEIAILGLVTILWAALHSWLASSWMKRWAEGEFGTAAVRGYRLMFNLLSVVSALPIILLLWLLPDHTVYAVKTPWSYLLLAGQGLSALLLMAAVLQTGVRHFSGLSQLTGAGGSGGLLTTGFYAVVRHPLYFLGLLFIWLRPTMSRNELVVTVIFSAYFFIGALLEENRLMREFGQQYADYRVRTPMIFPWPRHAARPQG